MSEESKHILVVDDEDDICEILKFNLECEGFIVDKANSAEDALKLNLTDYDLLMLDIMMGEMSGTTMAKIVKSREETKNIPIIFLSAKDTENDKITGLTIGADDYVSKPFSVREVILRVKAVLRRSNTEQTSSTGNEIVYKTIRMVVDRKSVTIDGKPISLTKKEFEILKLLLSNQGKVFSREDMLSIVWPDDVLVLDRTVDVNITRLRKKIEPYSKCITTRQGYGYCFEDI